MQKRWERSLFYPSLAIVLFAGLLLTDCLSHYAKSFNEKEWLTSGVRGRGRMADDLVNRQLLVGKARKEILNTLGKPDRESRMMLEYQVAHIPRCSWIWNCYVQVFFDKTDNVVGTLITD